MYMFIYPQLICARLREWIEKHRTSKWAVQLQVQPDLVFMSANSRGGNWSESLSSCEDVAMARAEMSPSLPSPSDVGEMSLEPARSWRAEGVIGGLSPRETVLPRLLYTVYIGL